jgi:hypothetical protein
MHVIRSKPRTSPTSAKQPTTSTRRANGEVDADEATDLLLTYNDPANDPWIQDLPRLRLIPVAKVAAATGLTERHLRDIYAGISTPHHKNELRIQGMLRGQTSDN